LKGFLKEIPRLLESNVGLARNKKLVIISSCILQKNVEILESFSDSDTLILRSCPEAEHWNIIAYKLASFISYSKPKQVIIVSVEGSPHCVQLHHIAEDIKKNFIDYRLEHFVLSKNKLWKISPESVKTSRHLLKIEKLLQKKEQ